MARGSRPEGEPGILTSSNTAPLEQLVDLPVTVRRSAQICVGGGVRGAHLDEPL